MYDVAINRNYEVYHHVGGFFLETHTLTLFFALMEPQKFLLRRW